MSILDSLANGAKAALSISAWTVGFVGTFYVLDKTVDFVKDTVKGKEGEHNEQPAATKV